MIENNNLPESVQLIQYDDQIDERDADSKPPCDQMKQYIDQWYQTADNFISNPMVCDEIVLKKDFNWNEIFRLNWKFFHKMPVHKFI